MGESTRGGMPEFSTILNDSTQSDTEAYPEPSVVVKKPDDMPDFSGVVAAAPPTVRRKVNPNEADLDYGRKTRRDFYDSIGLRDVRLRAMVDILPDVASKIWEMNGQDVDEALDKIGGTAQSTLKKAREIGPWESAKVAAQVPGALVKGLASMVVQQPLELIVNKKVGLGDIFTMPFKSAQGMAKFSKEFAAEPQLTAEEQEERAKMVGANIIGIMTGRAALRVAEGALSGEMAIVGNQKTLATLHEATLAADAEYVANAQRANQAANAAKAAKAAQVEGAATGEAGAVAGNVAAAAPVIEAENVVVDGFSQVGRQTLNKMLAELDVTDPKVLERLAQNKLMSPLTRARIGGAIEGVVGGFATGFVEGDRPSDSLYAGATYAAMALPLGITLEMAPVLYSIARGKPQRAYDVAASLKFYATDAWTMRQVKMASEQPAGMIISNLANVAEGQGLATTMALGAIEYRLSGLDKNGMEIRYGANAVVIPVGEAAEVANIQRIVAERAEDTPAVTSVHVRTDGTHEVLVAPKDMPKSELGFFSESGYLHGQQVGYDGSTDWVIDKLGKKTKGKDQQLTLRHLVTDERVNGLTRADLTRLDSTKPGDLRLHMGRMITEIDVFDMGQGFIEGLNTAWTLRQGKNMYTSEENLRSVQGVFPEHTGGKLLTTVPTGRRAPLTEAEKLMRTEVTRIRNLATTDPIAYQANIQKMHDLEDRLSFLAKPEELIYIDGKPAKYGVNVTKHIDADGNESGVIIYVGGGEERALGADGKMTKIPVGEPNTIVSFALYKTDVSGTGQKSRGITDLWSTEDAPNRTHGVARVLDAAGKVGVERIFSSVNKGSARGMAKIRNIVGNLDRQDVSALTRHTGKSLETAFMEDFLDFIGAKGDDRMIMHPDQILARRGWRTGGEKYEQAHIRPGEPLIGMPGAALETARGQIPNVIVGRIDDASARTFTESKRMLSDTEAEQLARANNTADAVPTTRREANRAIDRTQMSWADVVTSYMEARGVTREASPRLAQWLEKNIGKELLGGPDTIRARLTDKSKLPIHQEMLEKAKAELAQYDNIKTPTEFELAEITELKNQVETYTTLIDKIKRDEPLPFSQEERGTLTRMMGEAAQMRIREGAEFATLATEAGYAVEHTGGNIRLREIGSDARLDRVFGSREEAMDFLKESGRPEGVDLDGGGDNIVPPSSVASHMPPPGPQPRMHEAPHQFAPNTRVTKVVNFLDSVAPWGTTKRQFFIAMDAIFGTKFYDEVYLPTQAAKMKTHAVARPFLNKVKDVENILMGSQIPRDQWARITEWIETKSPQEIIDGHIQGRAMNAEEQAYAQRLATDKIDIKNVYGYTRATAHLDREFNDALADLQVRINGTQDPAGQLALREELDALNKQYSKDMGETRAAFNIDDKHLKAHEMFKRLRTNPSPDLSLDAITRLARAAQDGELSRGEWAVKNKLTPHERAAGEAVAAVLEAVNKHLSIDKRVADHLAHYRHYTQMPDEVPRSMQEKVMREAAEEMPSLASKLIQSGEFNVYERDPVNTLIQYVNSTFADQYFNPVWKASQKAATAHLKEIPRGRQAAADVVSEYMGGMRGVPAASDEMAQLSFNKMLDALDIKVHPDIKKDLVNTWLAAQSGSFLGFRPAQGLRDFTQFSKIYYSRFGAKRFANGLRLAFERDKNGVMAMERFATEGTTPGLSVLQFATEEELAAGLAGKAGKVKDALFAMSEAGLKTSLQATSYSLAHAIAYADTKDLVNKTLLQLMRGEIDKVKAYNTLSMNSYDIPVAEGFDRLVSAGKTDEAAEYLAQSTGAETAFLFGMSNHPYGWGTNIGKIAGQFGTWSVWDRNYLMRLAGRGTPMERAGSMARLASAEIATGVAGRALGFNMRSWYAVPGMLFAGGPAFAYVEQIEDMMGQRGKLKENLAKKMLTRAPPGQVPVINQVLPGSAAIGDYFQAWQLAKNRYGVVPVLGRAVGMTVDQTQKSWLDELMGNYPRLKKR